ncbi:MAG: polyhydroxyalkanoate synthesis regulator DNA-binding domain-containing protein [Myxococcales bacterium]|nr:polyhydroxyalkanoate synthesis regulator DNA-binding domain-containing protein [Myxococcales bacterium]
MDTENHGAPVRGGEPRVIKRYSNRKLYDTKDSRYVTLQQIGEMVRGGEDVRIIDNKTKEDKTEATLALIISEDLKTKPRSVPLGTLRNLLQERGERILSQLRGGPIGRFIPGGANDGTGRTEAELEHEAHQAHQAAAEATAAEAQAAAVRAGEEKATRSRLNELVESSRHALDERVRALVPGLAQLHELKAEVEALEKRVAALEAALASHRH